MRRKMKDFPGQRLFPGSRSSRLSVCSRFAAKEDEVSPLLLLAADLICVAPTLLPVPREQHHLIPGSVRQKGQGTGRDPGRAASCILLFMGSKRAAEDTETWWCREHPGPESSTFTPRLQSSPSAQSGGYNASILPQLT